MHLAERPKHSALEAAIQHLVKEHGYERMLAVAWTAGRHAEVSYAEWLDNLTGAPHRRARQREYAARSAKRAAIQASAHHDQPEGRNEHKTESA